MIAGANLVFARLRRAHRTIEKAGITNERPETQGDVRTGKRWVWGTLADGDPPFLYLAECGDFLNLAL